MPRAEPLPDEVATRAEAAEILGVDPRRVTRMRGAGRLDPATTPHRGSGLYWREKVEALADELEERAEREAKHRRATRR